MMIKRSAFNSLIECDVYILSLDNTPILDGIVMAKVVEIGSEGTLLRIIRSTHSRFSASDLVFATTVAFKYVPGQGNELGPQLSVEP